MKTLLRSLCCLISASVWAIDPTPILAENAFVVVSGSVRKPGKIQWSPDLTVTKAITMCGGLGWEYQRVFIIRGDDRIAVPLAAIKRGKKPDVKLQPGDTLDVNWPPTPQPSK